MATTKDELFDVANVELMIKYANSARAATNANMESFVEPPPTYSDPAPSKWPSQFKYNSRAQTTPKIIRQLAHSRKNN